MACGNLWKFGNYKMIEEKKRYAGNSLIGWLIVVTIVGAFIMFSMGKSALDMGIDTKEVNSLMYNQSIACATSNTKEECVKATKALELYHEKMKK